VEHTTMRVPLQSSLYLSSRQVSTRVPGSGYEAARGPCRADRHPGDGPSAEAPSWP
jgi:hypothetical protein